MKKLVFMFVALAAISFASCGNKENAGAANDSDSVAAQTVSDSDSVANDSAAADTTAAAATDSVAQ